MYNIELHIVLTFKVSSSRHLIHQGKQKTTVYFPLLSTALPANSVKITFLSIRTLKLRGTIADGAYALHSLHSISVWFGEYVVAGLKIIIFLWRKVRCPQRVRE